MKTVDNMVIVNWSEGLSAWQLVAGVAFLILCIVGPSQVQP